MQLKTAASPAERKEMLAQGHCSSRIPFFSHSGSGLGIPMTQSFHQCLQEGQAPAASRLFPLVLVGHKESCLGMGDSSSAAAALAFCAPKGGAVTFLKRLMLVSPHPCHLWHDCSWCHALHNCCFVVLNFSNAGDCPGSPSIYINVQNKDVLLSFLAELYIE